MKGKKEMKIYVKKWYSKKNEKEYIALVYHNGRRECIVTFDRLIIADLLGVTCAELRDAESGTYPLNVSYSARKE